MKKITLICAILLAVTISGIFIYFQWIHKPLHMSISKENVMDIKVYGLNMNTTKIQDDALIENIIEWFNSAKDIRHNKDFEGTTSESGIIINLKSGKRILILRSGRDFEIQRDDVSLNNISYWAKQQELKDYLDKLASKTEGRNEFIDYKLDAIVNNPKTMFSSNPYDYIKDNNDYEYIINQGDEALDHMLRKFEKSKDNGLKEYIMAIACSEILGEKPENKKWSSGREWYEGYTKKVNIDINGSAKDVYIAALDSFMPLDEGLNGGMKYIAIDGSTLKYVSESEKREIMKYFEKYGVKVMNASFKNLKEMGLFNEKTFSLEGILLSIKKTDILSKNKIVLEGSKYRSGLGAIGVKCVIVYKDTEWQVESSNITWIS